jgi:tRNA(Ile2) C34 agmatinyltransferase TiaS
MRPTLGGSSEPITQTYAVCPACNERQEFTGKPSQLHCTRCSNEAAVDWSVTC